MRAKQRRKVMKTIRDGKRTQRSDVFVDKPDQGRAMECVGAHSTSHHFLRNGDFMRFADWRFVHRARLNLVPLNGASSWRVGDRRCRRCGYITESLAHVTNYCMPKIYIVDATVVFENRMAAFQSAAAEKKAKYEELRLEMAAQHVVEVAVVPFIVESPGSMESRQRQLPAANL
jgi:hypothetical protein